VRRLGVNRVPFASVDTSLLSSTVQDHLATVCQDTNGANAIFAAGQCSLDTFETEVSGPITGLRRMLEQAENKAGLSFSLPRLALHVTLLELLLVVGNPDNEPSDNRAAFQNGSVVRLDDHL